ncbi:hypothetical protein NC652_028151 [Populus alba x Populus x berolinensis]|nr:hypothetical protein NC652_028151 [Populus alba x Populus x berolinensis]
MLSVSSREKERVLLSITRCLGYRRFAMLLLVSLALLVFIWGSFTVIKACPVCYLFTEQARASMPCSSSASPVLHNLTYVVDENPVKTKSHGGSDFGGYPSLKQRNDSFDIRNRPGFQIGFDINEADLMKLEDSYEVIISSAIFGNYDIIQQPQNISEAARKNVPFYMFIDKETEMYLKNSSTLDSNMRIGPWRIIVVRNIPYTDARRNGKVPKLLLHRLLLNVRFLWQQNASFAISRHYCRFDVFEEAKANKAAGKYGNSSIDYKVEFYKKKGFSPYSKAKLPITSDVLEGYVIVREYIPITNLFSCLWFNEVDRFTARDQLSFSTVRHKIMAKVEWSINMFLDCERRLPQRSIGPNATPRLLLLFDIPCLCVVIVHPGGAQMQGFTALSIKSNERFPFPPLHLHECSATLNRVIALTCGALMMFYTDEVIVLGHGIEVATKLKGSTSHDQLLIQTSKSFSGLLLFAVGFLLFMVAFVRDKEFQIFFAKGCTSLHVSVAFWRVYFEQKLEDLARDLLRLVVGDIALALSWVFFLVYSWREKFVMSGLPLQNASPSSAVSQVSLITTSGQESKPKKKICCACPETKKLRDECIVEHGEAACAKWIDAHRQCLRAEGFNI